MNSSDRTILAVIGGSKAVVNVLQATFGKSLEIRRCPGQDAQHDGSSVEGEAGVGALDAEPSVRTDDHSRGKRILENLARQLEREHSGAAASVRERIEQTLTAQRPGLSGAWERTFSTTNGIEEVIGRAKT